MKFINIEIKEYLFSKICLNQGIKQKLISIISCTESCIKSYIFNPLFLSLSLYKKYIAKGSLEQLCFEIFTSDGFQTKIIELNSEGIISIWNFNCCELLNINNINEICLYKN